jgi:hypothetical protein
MSSSIIVATHKEYIFPKSILYSPVHVGKALQAENFSYPGDDTGENISRKNASFCELTALYWAWKNEFFKDKEFCGLAHYRRYFVGALAFGRFSILSEKEILKILADNDVIVPKKRKYYIENVRSHYINAHYKKDLELLEIILREFSPEYMGAFETVMNQTSLHLFNMFVMQTKLYNEYCLWLFSILFELEKRVDISKYDSYQGRVFGFLAERLFNVWLVKNKLKTKEISIVNIEGENLFLKAVNMLKRKYFK